jgi:hypothetical protein
LIEGAKGAQVTGYMVFFTLLRGQRSMIRKIQRINFQTLWYAFTVVFTREAFVLLIYMAVSASVLNIFMQTRSLKEVSAEFGFSSMLEGSAIRPNVYRQLVPVIANYVASLVSPEERPAFVERHLDRYHLKQLYFGKATEMLDNDFKLVDD